MRALRIVEALREAIAQMMSENEDVFLIGEDVRIGGGFAVSKGLVDHFGRERVLDTPISETAFTGLSIGAAMSGMRPIVEYQFGDFVFCAMDQVVNEAAKLRYMSGGQVSVPITFRLPVGANRRGAQHAQCTESIFLNVPGLLVVCPATPFDAKGLLISAIRNENPVLFYEHKLLYNLGGPNASFPTALGPNVPEEPYEVPFGKAAIRRSGQDATVVATMLMLHRSLAACDLCEKDGIRLTVVDPRTLVPLDIDTICDSVKKTGNLVVVEEAPVVGGWANEIIAGVHERLGQSFRAKRVGMTASPVPYSVPLEDSVIPTVERIATEIRDLLA